ncbi:MAG TPA: thioesterase, partial [Alcanivorax sp.]|nr:thioesterase [Alcanivorax sp.]
MSEAALNGLETLQMLMREKRNPAIGDTLDFTLVEVEKGRAVFEGTPSEKVYNPIGSVHGGYAAALLDSACGCAVHA